MAPQKELVIKLTSYRYRKEGVSEEAFHNFGSRYHAPKAAIVQERHGALRVAQYYTPAAFRDLIFEKIPWAVRPGWEVYDHDVSISVWVRKWEDMLAIVMDPDFQSLVAGEEEVIDQHRAKVSAGWEEVYVEDGKIVNVVEGESQYPSFAEAVSLGTAGKATSAPGDITF